MHFDADEFRLYVEGATPTQFAVIKGQRELSLQRGKGTFSTATKDSKFNTNRRAGIDHTITCAYLPELPDALGATRVHTLVSANQTMRVQIRQAPFGDANVVYDAVMIDSGYNTDYPFRDAVGTQLTLVLAAAPTVDQLPSPPA